MRSLGNRRDRRLVLVISKFTTCNKIFSRTYNCILQSMCEKTLNIKRKWQKEGQSCLRWLLGKSMSITMELELAPKHGVNSVGLLLYGFFITLLQKRHHRIGGGDHYQIFWNCQVTVPNWQEIHKHVSNVFGVLFRCDTVYMSDISSEGWNINCKKKKIVKFSWQQAKRLLRNG